MLSSTCRNCASLKTKDFYAENYCEACMRAIHEAELEADKQNADIGAARRTALAIRAHDAHSNRRNPKLPFHKADYWSPAEN